MIILNILPIFKLEMFIQCVMENLHMTDIGMIMAMICNLYFRIYSFKQQNFWKIVFF